MSVESIVKAIESVMPPYRPVGHHDSQIGLLERQNLSWWLEFNGQGDGFLLKLEHLLCTYCDVPYVVPTNSGTSALHLALIAVGVTPGEEVIVPNLTFAGTANAVHLLGAIPHFIDPTSLSLSGYDLRDYLKKNTAPTKDGRGRLNPITNRVISAVIAVDLLGFPADLIDLQAVAYEFGLQLIEDAAQALGSQLENRKCGSYGSAAILSFNSNKIVTGHGGGALLTKSKEIADKARHLGATARVDHPWKVEHTGVGYNYRMSSLTAAVICAQLERIEAFLAAKKQILQQYATALTDEHEVFVLSSASGRASTLPQPNYWLISLVVVPEMKTPLLRKLHEKGIHARALFTPLHKMFPDCPHQAEMPNSEYWYERVVCLPSGVAIACQ